MFFLHRPPRTRAEDEPRGQILIIVAAALVIMVAMTGLVVDGGYAWGQQRDNQNAADAASEAGAVVLAEKLTGEAANRCRRPRRCRWIGHRERRHAGRGLVRELQR